MCVTLCLAYSSACSRLQRHRPEASSAQCVPCGEAARAQSRPAPAAQRPTKYPTRRAPRRARIGRGGRGRIVSGTRPDSRHTLTPPCMLVPHRAFAPSTSERTSCKRCHDMMLRRSFAKASALEKLLRIVIVAVVVLILLSLRVRALVLLLGLLLRLGLLRGRPLHPWHTGRSRVKRGVDVADGCCPDGCLYPTRMAQPFEGRAAYPSHHPPNSSFSVVP